MCHVTDRHVADPRTKDWMFMSGPMPLLTILITYHYFCTSAGPRWMKDRKPFDLKYVLIVYNALQVIFSIWLVYEVRLVGLPTNKFHLLSTRPPHPMTQQPITDQGLLIIEASRYATPHAVWLLRMGDQPDEETFTCPGGIRTRNPSKRVAADPRLRPRGHHL